MPGPRAKDITGQRFERLIAIERVGTSPQGYATWKCVCDCGNIAIAVSSRLQNGTKKSCGCMLRDPELKRKAATKHGHTSHSLYHTWAGMIARCEDPRAINFKGYGGRGIKVCERWHDFAAFVEDVGDKPFDTYTIDRINNDGNYEPGNVRWASKAEQVANRRKRVKG